MTGPETIFGVKLATLIASFFGAAVSIVVDFKTHSFFTATSSLVAGVFIAAVATEPTIEFFNLTPSWGHAIAAVFGISGRNLVVWIARAAQDPPAIIANLLKGWRK